MLIGAINVKGAASQSLLTRISAVKSPPAAAVQLEEDLPEIVSTGTRIQWWQWMLAGGAAVALLSYLKR